MEQAFELPIVSTHSRPKAAGYCRRGGRFEAV